MLKIGDIFDFPGPNWKVLETNYGAAKAWEDVLTYCPQANISINYTAGELNERGARNGWFNNTGVVIKAEGKRLQAVARWDDNYFLLESKT